MPDPSSPCNLDNSPVRVLLVDNAAHVRSELRQLLELSGKVQVVGEAADGLEAIRLAVELTPEVIVMDLEMPNLDGFEATRRIKAQQSTIRVVILSVHSKPGDIERCLLAGADGFVIKGADYTILLNTILAKDRSNHSLNKGENS
jgi:DNA-binding NarL/FixJ family response regulator